MAARTAPKIGYFLSCEEYTPQELLQQARLAEQAGFESLWISDHFHPWNDEQGQSPFVWSMIGATSPGRDHPGAVGRRLRRPSRAALHDRAGPAVHAARALAAPLCQRSPRHFEQASSLVTPESTRDSIAYGTDVERHVEAFGPYFEAGIDSVHISQIGARQEQTNAEGFFAFYADQVLPKLRALAS
jgi:hypothetical protein